jgi:succinate dehydrogenase / fumarate reductase flavoprotein subunit
VIDGQYVSQLLVTDGVCFGALAFGLESGERTVFLADAVVLATGGHTRIWRRSSSRRDENTGDGMYLALRAGCRLQDMELVQFHPTGMVSPEEVAGTLVTEAVRGEGGHLKNALGERFMARYDPERMELSARDRVALANYTEIAQGRGGPNGGVFLDITHLGKDAILEKLPRMYRQFLEYQMLDISQEPMEVAPTAHYSMGGVVVDPDTHATDVAGLYAAGEVTAGLHGANRLGGNSLAETIVFGRRAGEAAASYSASRDLQLRARQVVSAADEELSGFIRHGRQFARPLQRALHNAMWATCGVVPTRPGWGVAWSGWPSFASWPARWASAPPPRATPIWPTLWTCAAPWPPPRPPSWEHSPAPRAAAPTSAATTPSSHPGCRSTSRPAWTPTAACTLPPGPSRPPRSRPSCSHGLTPPRT